jgi:tripartite-type tricarboxylate transporter receptor subunit TctC
MQCALRYAIVVAQIAALATLPEAVRAQTPPDNLGVADFYRGKQMRMIIRSGPGGGYDLYSRLLARHLVNHIPGNPTIIAQNMPAAGGIAAINYVAANAPLDGTVITMVSQSAAIDRALGLTSTLTTAFGEFNWIGNLNDSNPLTYVWHGSSIKTIDDARRREATLGSTGAGDISSWLPNIYNRILGTKFKIIEGYRSGAEVKLAMERGELDGFGANPLSSLLASAPDYLRDKKVTVLVQVGVRRETALPDVPVLMELGRNDEEKQILAFVAKGLAVGRPIGVGPGVPAERVAALRRAFDATVSDPEFIAEARKQGLDIGAMAGVNVQQLVNDVLGSSADIKARVRAVLLAR